MMTIAAAAGSCTFRRSPGGAAVDQRARDEIAAALLGAYDSGKPIDPPTERHPDLAADDAHEIQLLQVSRWTAAGARVAGHEAGLTSAARWRRASAA
jgi:2-keto-4-pentenoate hydratase